MTSDQESGDREFEDLRQAVLDDWVVIVTRTAGAVEAMKSTVSWRVTAPLRVVKVFQRTAREQGFSVARDLAAVAIARRIGRG